MGLKGYKLWVMGQLDSNVQIPAVVHGVVAPVVGVVVAHRRDRRLLLFRVVALQAVYSKGKL
jgi:hypothetical protein